MSVPISQCIIFKAAKDDKAFDKLVDILDYNTRYGSMSIYPCKCNPPCTATDDELNALLAKINSHKKQK